MSTTYKKLYAKCEKTGIWQYGCNWLRMIIDESSHNLYIAGREWNQDKEGNYKKGDFKGIDKAYVIIRPDDILVVNNKYRVSSIMLGQLGIHGKFIRGTSLKAVITYRHALTEDYEGLPFMELHMKDGVPLKARKLDDIHYNNEKLIECRKRMKELRAIYVGFHRLGNTDKVPFTNRKIGNKTRYTEFDTTVKKIVNLMTNINKANSNTSFVSHLDELVKFYGGWSSDSRSNKFDLMMKFHKVGILRQWGAVPNAS